MHFRKTLQTTAVMLALASMSQAGPVVPGSEKMFNPQPEPPPATLRTGGIDLNPAAKHGFNPQPEPPPKEWLKNKLTGF